MDKARWQRIPWGVGDIIAYGIILALALAGFVWLLTGLARRGYLARVFPDSLSILVISALIQSILMIGISLWIARSTRGATWGDLGLGMVRGGWLAGAVGGFAMLGVALAYSFAVGEYFSDPPPQSIVLEFSRHMGPRAILALIMVVVVMAPVTEELVFRGFVYGGLRKVLGFFPAALLTSVIFAAVHLQFNWVQFFQILLLGLILAWLYEHKGNLVAPMVAHAVYNGSVALLLIAGALGGGF